MISLSKCLRTSGNMRSKFIGYWDPEVWLAENIADYRGSRNMIPPWFKAMNHYAYILFHNVSIDAIEEKGRFEEKYVYVHDVSGLCVMAWTNSGDCLPAEKPYLQMLQERELRSRDHVYLLIFRHEYEYKVPFVAAVEKFRPPRNAKRSLLKEQIFHCLGVEMIP